MKKKAVSLILAVALSVVSLTGCGESSTASTEESKTTESTEAVVEEDSAEVSEVGDGVSFSFFGAIWTPFVEESPILDTWQMNTNAEIAFEWVQQDSYDTQIATRVASQNLPDVIKKEDGKVNDLINQGLLLPITDYLEEYCPNYMSWINEQDRTYLVNADDGEIYGLSLVQDNPAAYSTAVRSDWLERLNLEMPKTWEDWVKVWTAFKEQDANGNGNTSDEIPLAIRYDQFYMLLGMFGINSNGYFSVEDGEYIYDPENPKYELFLDSMKKLYEQGIFYNEYITCTSDQISTIGSNNTLGTMVNWAEQAKNYTLACREMGDATALYSCITPIAGPNGDAAIPSRAKIQQNTFFTIAAKDRLPEILTAIDYLFSEEGVVLTNYGIEGETFEYVDGSPVVSAPYNESFATARGYDLIPTIIPFCFVQESYMQYLLGGQSYEDLDEGGKSFVDGLTINDDYYYSAAPTFATEAWVDNADLVEKQVALRDNYIMGKITKEQYQSEYQTLKDNGLQAVIDQATAAYDAVSQ